MDDGVFVGNVRCVGQQPGVLLTPGTEHLGQMMDVQSGDDAVTATTSVLMHNEVVRKSIDGAQFVKELGGPITSGEVGRKEHGDLRLLEGG